MDDSEDFPGLRRGLRDLADEPVRESGPAPVMAVVARGRRIRRVRRSLAAGAATLVVAGGFVLGVSGKDRPAPPSGPTAGPVAPTYPYEGKYAPQPPSGPHDPLDTGPRRPVEDVRYRYDLSAVCDLRYAVFGGRLWERTDGGSPVTARWAADRMRGFMSWTDGLRSRSEPDTAVFETESPDTLPSLRFRPLAGPAPECLGQEPERRYGDAPAATLGPKRPERGVRYPYDMTKECETRYAVFAGRLWRAEGEGEGRTQTIVDWVNDLPLAGFMTLTSERTAVLEWPGAWGAGSGPRTTTFRPVEARGDDCPDAGQ